MNAVVPPECRMAVTPGARAAGLADGWNADCEHYGLMKIDAIAQTHLVMQVSSLSRLFFGHWRFQAVLFQ
jgi:hypothetical protein